MSEDHVTASRQATASDDRAESDQFERWYGRTGRAIENADAARVEVYVRSLLPPPGAKESQTRVIEAIEGAVEESPVRDVLVEVWGERLCLCESCRATTAGRAALGRVRELEDWGTEFDASVGSFFERCHTESTLTGGSYEGIVPPRVTAALYVDGSVRGVFPCRFGSDCYSVEDFCEALPGLVDPAEKPEPVGSTQ